jgi:hypothetical protein
MKPGPAGNDPSKFPLLNCWHGRQRKTAPAGFSFEIPSNRLGPLYRYQATRPQQKQHSGPLKRLMKLLHEFFDRW